MSVDIPPAIEALAAEVGSYVFRDESILGTRMQLSLVARNFPAAKAAALAIRAEIDRLNLIFNSRDPNSELSILNRSSRHQASSELFAVIAAAERWRIATNSAFSARLGRVLGLWQAAMDSAPAKTDLALLARDAERADVILDAETKSIMRPAGVEFALEGFAKGWIVDRAFEVACAHSDIFGSLVDIGGDIRCGGRAPQGGWHVGISDPHLPFDNAPVVATAQLSNHGIATSGLGARDRIIGGVRYSPTLSPFDGWPISHNVSATVIASSAADADALATALLVLPVERAQALADAQGVQARITTSESKVAWTSVASTNSTPAKFAAIERPVTTNVAKEDWRDGWQALATFTAPRRQLIRDPDFRSPYMAMWITTLDNQPVRTLILIGKRVDWQRDNFIWWSINREKKEKLIATRSMSTSGAGVYNVFWDGVDDLGRVVPAGQYVLHVETSRERGQHTYRSLTLDFNKPERFVNVLPPTEEGGGLRVSFDHY